MTKSRSNSSSSSKKSVKKTSKSTGISKYASKFVDQTLSDLISKRVKSVQSHQKATEKWLQKARLSVLKKVSVASRSLFYSLEYDPKEINDKIISLQHEIKQRKENLLQASMEAIKQSPVHEIPTMTKDDGHRKFQDQAIEIKEKVNKIVPQLQDLLQKEMLQRIKALASLIETTEDTWKTKQEQKISTSVDSEFTALGLSQSSKRDSNSNFQSSTTTTGTGAARLRTHLNKY